MYFNAKNWFVYQNALLLRNNSSMKIDPWFQFGVIFFWEDEGNFQKLLRPISNWYQKKLTRNWLIGKGKSSEVLFHGITWPYSYFEVIWIFKPIQQEAKHDQEKLSARQNWKICWTVKLFSWNIVNLSHLYMPSLC